MAKLSQKTIMGKSFHELQEGKRPIIHCHKKTSFGSEWYVTVLCDDEDHRRRVTANLADYNPSMVKFVHRFV